MSKTSKKYYVVWAGVNPGIYESWTECELQIKGFAGARYKSFATRQEAEEALAASPDDYRKPASSSRQPRPTSSPDHLPPEVLPNSLAVDAACSGNPGQMEYRGVYVGSGQQVFHFGPLYGTNNIGEFLAIVHGLALMQQRGLDLPLYSDSVNAMSWVRQRKCKTKLPRNARTEELYRLIERAEQWLQTHTYTTPILKWDTPRWGEIPADFGRK